MARIMVGQQSTKIEGTNPVSVMEEHKWNRLRSICADKTQVPLEWQFTIIH